MIFNQKWQGAYIDNGQKSEYFPCTVPGNIQLDYSKYMGWGDVNYGSTCARFKALEDYYWTYKAQLEYDKKDNETVWFVTNGIEYEYDVLLNGEKLCHHIGMFSKVEIDITDKLTDTNILEVLIYSHPKREGADECRDQADQSCKPACQYGWDWHPRLLASGIWEETYIETRNNSTINDVKVTYTLNKDLTSADVSFDIRCDEECEIEMYSPDGVVVYKGKDTDFTIDNVMLWWCNGQGEPNLYTWKVSNKGCSYTGHTGFKKVRLVMNEGAWIEPSQFPKSRSVPPVTFELNGRKIFAKGTNWVPPELFTGTITKTRYEELLVLVKDANMNMVRSWGGAVINKEPFFDLCDELGLLVWQEFPLACNNYKGTKAYLEVLEQEANAIIDRVGRHVCLAMWCGGNELYNNWSKMTDQSYALRLLNKLCFEKSWEIPFIPTAPVMGMGHGFYLFYDKESGKTVHEIYADAFCTAYTEFGSPGIAYYDILKEIIPQDEFDNIVPENSWGLHHGFGAWDAAGMDSWLCFGLIGSLFGKQDTLEDYIKYSEIMQREGVKFIFEEARRQKPYCSIALNWCFNEPWSTVAGQTVVAYPLRIRKAYYDIKNSLKPVVPSVRLEHFRYHPGDWMKAELYLLNDSTAEASDNLEVYIEIDGKKELIAKWETGVAPANTNKRGIVVQYQIPYVKTQLATVTVSGSTGENSCLVYIIEKEQNQNKHALNI